ncbi:MAG TPA: EF-hand domain-containing protein [Pirellulales bacterium]
MDSPLTAMARHPYYRPSVLLGVAIYGAAAVLLLACGRCWAANEKVDQAETAEPRVTLKPADADGDGQVTRAEWGRLMQRFSRLDANHDGAIDRAELQADAKTSESPILLPAADTDGDGQLSRAEWKRLAQGFRRFDGNHDGALDLPELEAVAAATADIVQAVRAMPSLNGLWRGWIVEGRGENPNAGMLHMELAITGNRIAGREVKPLEGDAPLAVRGANATPDLGIGTFVTTRNGRGGFFDAMYLSGPHSGQTCLGLYRLEGDVLYWCATNRSGQRPDIFSSGNGCYLMILHRTPAAK